MPNRKREPMVCIAVALLVLGGWSGASLSAQELCGNWEVVPGLSPGETNSLVDLAVVSPDDIWAVGSYRAPGVLEDTPFSAHWDGNTWTQIAVPCPAHPLDVDCSLGGVDALAPDDVWAVGSFTHPDEFDWETFVVHWDGSDWQWIDSPTQPNGSGSRFYDVAALAPDDIWAIGGWPGEQAGGQDEPLAAHWDGSRWETVFVPYNTNGENFEKTSIHRLAVVSPDDIWAIGNHSGLILPARPFIVRWDGTSWNVMETRPGPLYTGVTDIFAASSDDVWISAAKYNPDDIFSPFKVLLHWDGSEWTEVDEPGDPFPGSSNLSGTSETDAWASANGELSHWDGASWSLLADMPDPTLSLSLILDLEAISGCEVWAVGQHTEGNMFLRLSPLGDPQRLGLDGFRIRRGLQLGGDLGSLETSDDDRLEIDADAGPSNFVTETLIAATSPEPAPSRLDLGVELGSGLPLAPGARGRLSLWRWDNGTWETVSEFSLTGTETLHEVLAVPGPSGYVRPTDGEVRLRVFAGVPRHQAPDGFVLSVDLVSLEVTP